MKRKNTALTVAAVALMICIASVVAIWYIMGHVFVDGRSYSRDSVHLDLRGKEISAEHYEKLRRKLPGCQIQWDIPFQDTYLPQEEHVPLYDRLYGIYRAAAQHFAQHSDILHQLMALRRGKETL